MGAPFDTPVLSTVEGPPREGVPRSRDDIAHHFDPNGAGERANSTDGAPPRYTVSVSAHAPPTTRAKKLVSFANRLAIASLDDDLLHRYPPLLKRSPLLIGRLVWDFFATVAGVGVAFAEIADTVPEAEQEALCCAVADALTAWNPRGYNALTDFLKFVRQGVTRGAPLPALIGTWIIRNVLPDHRPAAADFDLFPNAGSAIGMVFLRAFHGWWQRTEKRPRGVNPEAHRRSPSAATAAEGVANLRRPPQKVSRCAPRHHRL